MTDPLNLREIESLFNATSEQFIPEWAQPQPVEIREHALEDARAKLRAFISSVESLERLVARLKEQP